jgi:3-hydroxyisobutyrate dehydrogenase-like beta-hydroxyacid dehydrogenase
VTDPQVAVVGMGRMGAAMARRLDEAGFAVTVHNRSRERAAAVAEDIGAAVAATPREAAASAPIVVCSLADDAAVRAVYEGEDGLAAGLAGGTVVLETSTVAPETVEVIAPLVRDAGATLLDAPVSGSVPSVQAGSLMIMVGGDEAAIPAARPVLDALAARVHHVGRTGAGATMKLAVNALVHAINVAVSEALVLAERAGIQRERAYEVFLGSAAAAPFLQYKRQAFEQPDATPVAFSIDLVAKDLDLILALAARVGAPMGQAVTNRGIVGDVAAAGLADADLSAVAEHLRATAGGLGAPTTTAREGTP